MRRTRVLVLATILLAACGGGEADPGAATDQPVAEDQPTAAAEEPGPECTETDELIARDNEWDPGCIVTSGSLTVANEDESPHTFTIAGSIDEPLEGMATIEVDVTDAAEPTGDTFFQCTIHPGMDGFLWVR